MWNLAAEKNLPRAFFINKMDRERADYDKTIQDIQDSFKVTVTPLQIPIGQEAAFEGVVDVLTGKAYKFDANGKPQPCDIPADLRRPRRRNARAGARGHRGKRRSADGKIPRRRRALSG
ncbi:MAG: hypothetical protein M5R36_03745 [Deltaproteobacteria bacterium]|nr:hypothetical protein [Deltaproteobacteria bacterium]